MATQRVTVAKIIGAAATATVELFRRWSGMSSISSDWVPLAVLRQCDSSPTTGLGSNCRNFAQPGRIFRRHCVSRPTQLRNPPSMIVLCSVETEFLNTFRPAHRLRKLSASIQTEQLRGSAMLFAIFVLLMFLWMLGMVSGRTIDGYVHLVLLCAVVVVLIRIIQGRRPLA